MPEILNSVDIILTTKDDEVVLIKRDWEPEEGKLCLIGGVQEHFESFEKSIERLLKKRLGISSKINSNSITLENKNSFSFKQIKTYDSGNDKRGGNVTIFSIETTLSKKEIQKLTSQKLYFAEKNNMPDLAFEQKKFVRDFFFSSKDYTSAVLNEIGVAIDLVILTIKDGLIKVLLTKRSKEPFKGKYSLPGGFVEKNLSLDQSAKALLKRDTNITNVYLEQLYTFGEPKRDSRGRVISISYYALMDYSKVDVAYSKKYDEIDWFSFPNNFKSKLAFDHFEIILMAIERIKNKVQYTNVGFQILPEKFTLSELQQVYETILGEELDKRNFRKKIKEFDIVQELDEYKKQGRMRPAQYFKFKDRTKETILKAKKWL